MTPTTRPLYPTALSDGFVLKPLRANDAEQFFALVIENREHLERYDPFVTEFQQVEDVRRVLAKIQDLYEHGKSLSCGIWEGERLIGYFICGELHTKAAKTGYGLAQRYEGQGIITRTGQVVLRYAFDVIGVKSAWLTSWTGNTASIRTAQRLGFKREPEILPAVPSEGISQAQYKYVLTNPNSR